MVSGPSTLTFDQLVAEFQQLDHPEERYEQLVELGRALPPLDEASRTPANKVSGCMSTVWMTGRLAAGNGRPVLELRAESDSLIVSGLIVILLARYSGRTPDEILTIDASGILDQFGLAQHLSPQRRNGLFAMIARIRQLATEHLDRGGDAHRGEMN